MQVVIPGFTSCGSRMVLQGQIAYYMVSRLEVDKGKKKANIQKHYVLTVDSNNVNNVMNLAKVKYVHV